MAAERGVRVYTVGIGTAQGSIITFRGWTVRVRLDEETLKRVARMTGAQYFNVGSAEELQTVYTSLGWSYFSCSLVRFGAKSRCTTSTCSSRHPAARRFAQLLDFIERLDVPRTSLHKKYDYPIEGDCLPRDWISGFAPSK
jgi:hypothetical protein